MNSSLKEQLLQGVERASPEEEQEFFKTHPYVAEVQDNKIFIDESKVAADRVEDLYSMESIHALKNINPEVYNKLYEAAQKDPQVMQWKKESYQHSVEKLNEKRNIEDWWNTSRFDQVIMGYVYPEFKGWDVNKLPYGTTFRSEMDNFKKEYNKAEGGFIQDNQTQLDDGSFLDMGGPTPLEEKTEEVFGLTPNANRPNILPMPYKQEDGSRQLTAPTWLYEAAKAVVAPGFATEGGQLTEEDVINFGLTFTGAGVASRVTKRSVSAIDDIVKTKKGEKANKEDLAKYEKEGVYHSDAGGLPYRVELNKTVKYDPYNSTDRALKVRYNELTFKNFVTPFKGNLSGEYPVNVGSRKIADFYDRGNPLSTMGGHFNISSDFSYLYQGKVSKEVLNRLFDFRIPKHQRKLRTALNGKKDMFPFTYKSKEGNVTYRNANELIDSSDFKKGHWELMEDPRVVEALRQNNYSGSIVTEMYTTNGTPKRLSQLHLYEGDSVTDLKLVQDTLPNMRDRMAHLKKNQSMWKRAVNENPTEQSETQLRKITQAINFVETLIVKKTGKRSDDVSESIAVKNLELRKKKLEDTLESGKIVDINSKAKLEELEQGIKSISTKTDDFVKVNKGIDRYQAGLDAGKLPEGDPRLGEGNVRNMFPNKPVQKELPLGKRFYEDSPETKLLLRGEGRYNIEVKDGGGYGEYKNLKDRIPEIGDSLYHETSLQGMRNIFKEIMFVGRRVHRNLDIYISDNLDLALGQKGKGFIVEFDPVSVQGRPNTKPGLDFVESIGGGSEYRITTATKASIKAIHVPDAKTLNKLKESLYAPKDKQIKKDYYMDENGKSLWFDFDNAQPTENGFRIPLLGKD